MERFVVDCTNVTNFENFIAATNDAFVEKIGGSWNGNLDAFNDYLSWPNERYELCFFRSDVLAVVLGHDAMAKRLEEITKTCHPTNLATIESELKSARRGKGPTLWDVLREILAENADLAILILL